MQQWKNDPKNDLSLIVFTDGMQNTAPLITPTGSGFLGLDPVAGFPQELRKRFVPIQTIAFGQPAQVDEDLLRNISYETSGVSYISTNATTVFTVFGSTLVALLKGNTVSLATNREYVPERHREFHRRLARSGDLQRLRRDCRIRRSRCDCRLHPQPPDLRKLRI